MGPSRKQQRRDGKKEKRKKGGGLRRDKRRTAGGEESLGGIDIFWRNVFLGGKGGEVGGLGFLENCSNGKEKTSWITDL